MENLGLSLLTIKLTKLLTNISPATIMPPAINIEEKIGNIPTIRSFTTSLSLILDNALEYSNSLNNQLLEE